MNIILLGATHRGLKFLQKLRVLCKDDRLTVFSFREEPWEPKYLDQIRTFAEENGAQFFETRNVAAEQFAHIWNDPVDLIFIVSWRYLLPKSLIDHARLAAVVFHDSLLPEYRGFSPTVWAMLNGEARCGVTMFHLAEDVDSGDVIAQAPVTIEPQETIAGVMEKCTNAYLTLLEQNIDALKEARAPRSPQDQSLATYTCKRMPEDNQIIWQQQTQRIHNLIRAVTHPYTGAYTLYRGSKMTIWSAQPNPVERRYVGSVPGRVIEIRPGEGVVVLTGDGTILIQTVQMEDELELCASDIINSITAKLG
jgi:methionyl-tRNA formyltransferase